MVAIYILEVIGAIFVLGVIGMAILFEITALEDKNSEDDVKITCALTGERCMYVIERNTCNGCPIAEEAEKIGNR